MAIRIFSPYLKESTVFRHHKDHLAEEGCLRLCKTAVKTVQYRRSFTWPDKFLQCFQISDGTEILVGVSSLYQSYRQTDEAILIGVPQCWERA